jgi:hypothetical protein
MRKQARELTFMAVFPFLVIASAFLYESEFQACTDKGGVDLPKLIVPLGAPIEKVEGVRWTLLENAQPAALTSFDKPCQINIKVPGRDPIEFRSYDTVLSQDHGIVYEAWVYPMSDEGAFKDAILTAKEALKRLMPYPNQIDQTIKEWADSQPLNSPFDKYSLNVPLGNDVDVFVELKNHDGPKKWVLVLTISHLPEGFFEP